MKTVGYVLPETEAEAADIHAELGPAAREVVREVAVSMGFERDEYAERVTGDVVATGRDAIFGSLLVVTTGTREEFAAWRERPPYEGYEVMLEGSDAVDHVAWHASPMAGVLIAATYQDEREAAVATLRRIAWGRLYQDVLVDE